MIMTIMMMGVLENVNSFLFAVMMTMKMAFYILVHFCWWYSDHDYDKEKLWWWWEEIMMMMGKIMMMMGRNYDDEEKKLWWWGGEIMMMMRRWHFTHCHIFAPCVDIGFCPNDLLSPGHSPAKRRLICYFYLLMLCCHPTDEFSFYCPSRTAEEAILSFGCLVVWLFGSTNNHTFHNKHHCFNNQKGCIGY